MRAQVVLSGPGGTETIWASGVVGPVAGGNAGIAAVRTGDRFILRGATSATIATGLATASGSHGATIKLTRGVVTKGTYTVWACAVGASALQAYTSTHGLGRATVTLSLTSSPATASRSSRSGGSRAPVTNATGRVED